MEPGTGDLTAGPLVVSAPRLITANDEPPLTDAAVRIRDGRIEAVGPPDRARRRRGRGGPAFPDATLLPGMIDCHEHVAGHSRFSTGTEALDEPDTMWAVVFAHYARETLPKGVTTLRIPGAHHGVDLVVDGPRRGLRGRAAARVRG